MVIIFILLLLIVTRLLPGYYKCPLAKAVTQDVYAMLYVLFGLVSG